MSLPVHSWSPFINFQATFSLYVLSVVGTYFSFLNFLYFGKNFVSFSSLSTRLCRAWAKLVIFGVSGMKAFSPWKPCHFCMNDIRTTSTTLLIKCSETSKESTECSIQSSWTRFQEGLSTKRKPDKRFATVLQENTTYGITWLLKRKQRHT